MQLWGSPRTFCDRVSRRDVIKVGSLATAGLTLPNWLRMKAAGAVRSEAPCKSVIMVFLAGGPSHFETFDPKPEAPVEIRGSYNPIQTSLPGVHFCETMPRHAKIAQQFSLVRSCAHTNPGHGGGQRWMVTGHSPQGLEDEAPHDYPNMASVVAKMRGPNRADMPASVRIPPGRGHSDAAFLGPAYSAMHVYSNGRPTGIDLENFVKTDRLQDRRELRKNLDALTHKFERSNAMDSMDLLEQQAFDIVTGNTAKEAFDLAREPRAIRERYGDHEAGRSLLLARRLVEAGVTFVSVRIGNWDHHGNAGGTIKSGAESEIPPLDQAMPTLIEDLIERGREDVMVTMWGEFGRTPRINSFSGRDHWPQAMSMLMTGGGLKRGQVFGSTNSRGEHPQADAVGPADVMATMYHQLGINFRHEFLNSSGRPIPILPGGEPIAKLL